MVANCGTILPNLNYYCSNELTDSYVKWYKDYLKGPDQTSVPAFLDGSALSVILTNANFYFSADYVD